MKRFSTSLVIREIQNKGSVMYQQPLSRISKVKEVGDMEHFTHLVGCKLLGSIEYTVGILPVSFQHSLLPCTLT